MTYKWRKKQAFYLKTYLWLYDWKRYVEQREKKAWIVFSVCVVVIGLGILLQHLWGLGV